MYYHRMTSLVLLFCFFIFTGWICLLTIPGAQVVSQEKPSKKEIYNSTHQMREGVRKDIWFAQEDKTRLHYRIESARSLLTLVPKNGKLDVIENLEQIKCWMQDKLYANSGEPMQQVRFFEADQGTYHYLTAQFLAKSVSLALFRLPGGALPIGLDQNTAFLKGVAKDVSFCISGKLPSFEAHHFKASLKQG